MKRREFFQQSAILPILASTGGLGQFERSGRLITDRDFCLDGAFLEFELSVGADLTWSMANTEGFEKSLIARGKSVRDRLARSDIQMPKLRVHSHPRTPHPSSREYCIWVLGVVVYSNVLDPEFPEAGRIHAKSFRRQMEQIYWEIEQVAVHHQSVWSAANPPYEPDFVNDREVVRN